MKKWHLCQFFFPFRWPWNFPMKYGGKALQQQTSFPLCKRECVSLVDFEQFLWDKDVDSSRRLCLPSPLRPLPDIYEIYWPVFWYILYIDNPQGSVCPRLCGPCPPRRRRRRRRPPRLRTPIRSPGRPWVRQKENYKNKNMMNAEQRGHGCPLS